MPQPRPETKTGPIPVVGALAREHGHRALRVAGIVLVVVALLAGVGGAIHLATRSATQEVTGDNVDRLSSAWTAQTKAGPVTGVAITAETLFASTRDGLLAYALPCAITSARTCPQLWDARVPNGPLSAPTGSGETVFAGSRDGHVYAFSASCETAHCQPLWNGETDAGPVSVPGVNDDFVYVSAGKLYAFPARCGTNDRSCPPAWVGPIPGRGALGAPAVGGGLVVVASRSPEGGITAFPAVCIDPCKPVWSGATNGAATAVALSADTAYVVARGTLMAFPLSCTGNCRPTWTGTVIEGRPTAPGAIGAPVIDGGRVFVGANDGTLIAFAEGCATVTCKPVRTWPLGSLPLLAPVVEGGVIYAVSTGGVISAIPLGCDTASPGCGSPWSESLGAGTGGVPGAEADGLYTGDDAGVIHAYTVPRG
jgi:outer membrane protein assembly factor BamB